MLLTKVNLFARFTFFFAKFLGCLSDNDIDDVLLFTKFCFPFDGAGPPPPNFRHRPLRTVHIIHVCSALRRALIKQT